MTDIPDASEAPRLRAPALRDPLARAMLAAWVNCAPEQLPTAMQAHTCAATMEAWQRVGRAALDYFTTTASANGLTVTIPAEALPERIGQLCRGERLSDGEDRICAGGCEQPIPAGHAIYWPGPLGEYPDDMDPSCISCAIDRSEREQGWCECNTPDLNEALAGPRAAVGEPKLIESIADPDCGCPEELWDAHGAHLHMHLNAGEPSNAHADFGDDGEAECEVTAPTIAAARAAFFAWVQDLRAAPVETGNAT